MLKKFNLLLIYLDLSHLYTDGTVLTNLYLHVPLAFLSAFDQGIFTSMHCGNFLDPAKVRKLTLSKRKIITYCHLKHDENSNWEEKGYMLNLLPIKKEINNTQLHTHLYASHLIMHYWKLLIAM